ncbi:MAG: type II secretion system F family protein [Candidatus Magasanikbacteria bacterium]|nr:type II secretion system F family protein [Candidatus Magasanikbacteria bacterium]
MSTILLMSVIVGTAVAVTLLVLVVMQLVRRWWSEQRPNSVADILLKLPVNPLTYWVTRQSAVDALARAAGCYPHFAHQRTLRYKELASWVAVLLLVLWADRISRVELIIFGSLLFGLVWAGPELWLKRRAAARRKRLEQELPAALDTIRLYVSAGKNISQAISAAAAELAGAWREIFSVIHRQLQLGVPLSSALRRAAKLAAVPDFQRLVDTWEQASQLGVSIGNTLAGEATLLRARRRYATQERARRVSVQIAFPLVLCIFPALLIIYLAPAILQLIGNWGG